MNATRLRSTLTSTVAATLVLAVSTNARAADPYASAADWPCARIAAELAGQNGEISQAADRLPSCARNYRTHDATLTVEPLAVWRGLCDASKGDAVALLRARQRVLEGCRLRGSAR